MMLESLVRIFMLSVVEAAFHFKPDDSYCCRYASMKDNCQDTCLEMFKSIDEVYLETLQTHLPTNCPKNSPDLVEFWNCLRLIYNQTEGAWIGRLCCEQAIKDSCRSTCLQAHSREDLAMECRSDYEENLFDCVYRQETKQKCCGRKTGVSSPCRHRCDLSFRHESGPTQTDIAGIASSCDETMAQCMSNYTAAVKSRSIESLHCCEQASDEGCRESCQHILRTEVKDGEIIKRLINACGDIFPHEPMWKCFLKIPKPSQHPGPFDTKLQCCPKSVSYNCKQLCAKIYSRPWSPLYDWNQFEALCEHSPNEIDLQQCLQEVNEPCRMGCSGLSFCTNFNNRPTSLFHNCDAVGDDMAREHFNEWSSGVIRLPMMDIPVKDTYQCEPEKWKAVACSLQIKPCSSRTGESIICQSDCVALLNKCADKKRFFGNMQIEELCENFSPSHLQSNCISLSTYTKPSKSLQKETNDVTQPCHPNPCPEAHVCVINRQHCDIHSQNCPRFRCFPGCKMGHGSEFLVNHGSMVRVPDPERGEGCFRSCVCSTTGSLQPCVDMPCTDKQQPCKLAGQLKAHGSSFYVDCNFCSCYGGYVTCTKRQCQTTEEEKRHYTGMPCNCPSYISSVCGDDGRTYPNACVATCLGRSETSVSPGSCLDLDPCHPNPCKSKERCVHTPRVCLTNSKSCRQYECLPKHRRCLRLLKNALPLLQGKVYSRHQHRYAAYQQIPSSSHFFSNAALLLNESTVCDANNQQFENICKLTRSKRRKLDYIGPCKLTCAKRHAQPVCGQDRVTYNHSCMADANGVLADYMGPCKSVSLEETEERCKDVVCPPLSNANCHIIHPPGSCCPLCGGLLRVLVSRSHLEAIQKTSWDGPVTVRSIIWLLRRQLHVLECQIYGYLTTEEDMAIVIVSTKPNPSTVQEEACTREAERLSNLINKRSPTLTSYLILSPLTAATLSPSDAGGGASTKSSSLGIVFFFIFIHAFVNRIVT